MKIYNAEDLLKISKNGMYELVNDIDFSGSTIKCIIDDFIRFFGRFLFDGFCVEKRETSFHFV